MAQTGPSTQQVKEMKNLRQSCAFYVVSRMVTIKLSQSEGDEGPVQQVKGRVFLYDDSCKTLILKIWDDES